MDKQEFWPRQHEENTYDPDKPGEDEYCYQPQGRIDRLCIKNRYGCHGRRDATIAVVKGSAVG